MAPSWLRKPLSAVPVARQRPVTPRPVADKPRRLAYREQQEWEQMESLILEAEQRVEACQASVADPAVAADHNALRERLAALTEAQQTVERLYARWAELGGEAQGVWTVAYLKGWRSRSAVRRRGDRAGAAQSLPKARLGDNLGSSPREKPWRWLPFDSRPGHRQPRGCFRRVVRVGKSRSVMRFRRSVPFMIFLGVLVAFGAANQAAFGQTAISLDGVDDHVLLPSGTIPESNLTIAMWVNPSSHANTALVNWGIRMGCFPSAQFVLFREGRIEMFTGCGEAFRLLGGTELTVGSWHHVAVSIDAVGIAVLYVNGVQDGTGDARGGIPVTSGDDLIGAAWVGDVMPPETHFNGAIDELQIYGRVLSPGEIAELYDEGRGLYGAVVRGGLLAGYHFDERSGESAADFAGGGQATLFNGVAWIPSTVAVQGPAFADFAARAVLRLRPPAAADAFSVRASFRLNELSDGIDPVAEEVHIEVGRFAVTLPAGSFRRAPNGRFRFEGVIDGVRIHAVLRPIRGAGNAFRLDVTGQDAELGGSVLPVTIGLAVGDDHGRTALESSDVDGRSER
jgi:hypothetical protein